MPVSKPAPPNLLEQAALSDGLRLLAARGELRSYRKGTLLIQEGDVGDTIYIILAGRLRAFASTPATDRELEYDTYGPGDFVGEMGLDGGPRSANVVVDEACVCAVVGRRTLDLHCREHPEFAFELLVRVIRRARAATQMAKQMVLQDAYARLRAWLDAHAVPQPDATRLVSPKPTHRRLSERLGCTREHITIMLGELKERGCLAVGEDGLRLLKPLPPRL